MANLSLERTHQQVQPGRPQRKLLQNPLAQNTSSHIDKRGSLIEGDFVAVKNSEFNNQQAATTSEVKA
jgi:hypothetical protein